MLYIRILEEVPGVLMFFSVNQLQNNDFSGNKESVIMYY